MRRSLAALMGGLILATLNGCGGGGGPTPQSDTTPTSKTDPLASIPGPASVTLPLLPPEKLLPGEILPPIEDDSVRIGRASQQVKVVNEAVLKYIATNRKHPLSLESLVQAENGGPFLDNGLLADPWGASLQYETTGIRNLNKKPDVWSLGPPSGAVFIGNWSEKPTPVDEIK